MVLTLQGRDNYVWIVRLARGADGKIAGEIIDAAKDKLQPQIEETIVEDSLVKLKIKNTIGTIDFQGLFDGHAIRGTLANGVQELYTARLLNTEATSLTDYADTAGPPASDIFQKAITAMKDQPNIREIVRIASESRTSPTSLDVLGGLLAIQSKFQFTDEDLLRLIDEYVECAKIWGSRMVVKAEMQSAEHLIASRRLPEVALKHLARAEELYSDKSEAFDRYIANYRDSAEIQIGLNKSRSESEADRAEAHVALLKLLQAQPYNAEILLALAAHCQATKQVDTAIAYYSDIVALPLLEQYLMSLRAGQPAGDPTPGDQLKKLWVERNGDDKGLDEHLSEVHHTKIDALIREIREKSPVPAPGETGDHTVLVELFTGGQSPPSIAADLAVTAMSAEYPLTDLVVLRYHQHIPGPDGMANQDGEDRFAYYEAASTPAVAVDGMILDSNQIPYAGPIQLSGPAFNMIRQFIDLRRRQSAPIRLQLEASVADGQLSIRAAVTGATEEQLPLYRLRLALAEDVVESRMPNGIRRHEMLVREMPGGARGIAPKKGELKYEYSMPVTDLQLHLDEYIQRFEAGNKLKFPDEMKPPIRGQFHLVGWVQIQSDKSDEKNPSKLIVQTAAIPVSGLGPATNAPESTPPAAPKNTTAPAGSSTTPPAPAVPE
ncbi:MAG: hypothetical protein H7062_19930, partial [Candidatus Saccharimonas sp.]|nr:hypothetical protein [Planctomycetaceae bacterium]